MRPLMECGRVRSIFQADPFNSKRTLQKSPHGRLPESGESFGVYQMLCEPVLSRTPVQFARNAVLVVCDQHIGEFSGSQVQPGPGAEEPVRCLADRRNAAL